MEGKEGEGPVAILHAQEEEESKRRGRQGGVRDGSGLSFPPPNRDHAPSEDWKKLF